MKNLQFILKENVEQLFTTDRVSTFGYKFELNGEWHGDYVVIKNPSVTAQDVMEALEMLCPYIEQTLKDLQEVEKVDLKCIKEKQIFPDCTSCRYARKVGDHEWECISDNYDIEHFTCYSPVDSGN